MSFLVPTKVVPTLVHISHPILSQIPIFIMLRRYLLSFSSVYGTVSYCTIILYICTLRSDNNLLHPLGLPLPSVQCFNSVFVLWESGRGRCSALPGLYVVLRHMYQGVRNASYEPSRIALLASKVSFICRYHQVVFSCCGVRLPAERGCHLLGLGGR